jgi:hypothetical protein
MFWEGHQAAKPAFVILMLLMMAAVSCLSLKEQPMYIGDSAIARERAVLWIDIPGHMADSLSVNPGETSQRREEEANLDSGGYSCERGHVCRLSP